MKLAIAFPFERVPAFSAAGGDEPVYRWRRRSRRPRCIDCGGDGASAALSGRCRDCVHKKIERGARRGR